MNLFLFFFDNFVRFVLSNIISPFEESSNKLNTFNKVLFPDPDLPLIEIKPLEGKV